MRLFIKIIFIPFLLIKCLIDIVRDSVRAKEISLDELMELYPATNDEEAEVFCSKCEWQGLGDYLFGSSCPWCYSGILERDEDGFYSPETGRSVKKRYCTGSQNSCG